MERACGVEGLYMFVCMHVTSSVVFYGVRGHVCVCIYMRVCDVTRNLLWCVFMSMHAMLLESCHGLCMHA